MKHTIRKLSVIGTVILGGALLTGCGSSSTSSKLAATDSAASTGSSISSNTNNTTTSPSPSPTSSSTSSSGTLPAATANFALIGAVSATSSSQAITVASGISTDDHLRVRVTAVSGGVTVVASGVSTNSTQNPRFLKYTVWVNGYSKSTGMLATNPGGDTYCDSTGTCTQMPHSEILDFSQYMTAGHGTVTVKISNAAYSTYCEWLASGQMGIWPGSPQYYSYLPMYCSANLYPVYQYSCNPGSNGTGYPAQSGLCGHVTKGTLDIETNGTSIQ